MADYLVGTLSGVQLGLTIDCLVQDVNLNPAHDEHETLDHNGNVAVYQQNNHRVEGTCNIKVPAAAPIPAPGMSLNVLGVEVPTYTADGTPTGGYTLGVSDTSTSYIVTGVGLMSSNAAVRTATINIRRYLENGIGTAQPTSAQPASAV